MKTIKTITLCCLILTLAALCLFILPTEAEAASSGTCGTNLTWTLDDSGTLTISGIGAMKNWSYSSNAPWYSKRSSVKKVVINNGVTIIGQYAFYDCDSLTSVTIPDSVTSIGSHAFENCTSLTSVTIPDSVTSIGLSAFSNCTSLTSVTILDSITSIGEWAFAYCDSLTSVTIPDSVTSIGSYAFSYCKSLTSVTIPNSVTSIGFSAFSNCTSLTSVMIPDSVTSIGYCAFYNCTSLTSVTIPDSVTSIAEYAFYSCTSLTSVIYCGTEEQWKQIQVGSYNSALTNATRYYHNWQPATCTEAKVCSICGQTLGEPLGHSGQWFELLAPTCTEPGVNACICDVCGETVIEEIPIIDHSYSIVITAPTCTEQGYTTQTCSVCGDTQQVNMVPAKGHSWSAWVTTVKATCTKTGTRVRFCNCGTRETEVIAKLPHAFNDGVCTTCSTVMSGYAVLSEDMHLTGLSLTEDLYVDLNGFDLSGTIITNGYAVYGMDSVTDGYTCENMGIFSCVDENGNAIVPVAHFKSDISGQTKRYMTIETESGYTFHRFYLGITKLSLAPNVTGFGYKAEFYGDEMVQAQIAATGFKLWLKEDRVVSQSKDGFQNKLTLRLRDFDVENHGETPVNANVFLTLTDGTVIESSVASVSMRTMLENINAQYGNFSATQLSAIKAMIEKHAIIKSWNTEKLYA